MGANPTQAHGLVVFLIAFTVMAAGFAADGSFILILCALALLGVSFLIFMKCKPWEHRED